jgi:hypothetical protein
MANEMKCGQFDMHEDEDYSKQVVQLQPDGVRSVTSVTRAKVLLPCDTRPRVS